ncbi:hypothetical protein B9Z19DRAFT_1087572 [Tuber borchii]|uniref:Uncharacterized protein n=1 Tax=Tuber borchii TaxID=42251 RepID=A0A2T6ZMU0_TUBBO|nr:hypothetical protein B9Z19DRAFT_1087572 [Tuber borchii]
MCSRKDWTNSRVAIAHAACVGIESENAGRQHVRFWNDYHVGNGDAGDGITRGGVGNLVAKSLIRRATVLVILQQRNRRWLKDGAARAARPYRAALASSRSRRGDLSPDRNTQKQEQRWQKVCPHCIGKCRRTTYKDSDGKSERKEFVEGLNVSSLPDTRNTSENKVSRILIGYCRSLKTCIC